MSEIIKIIEAPDLDFKSKEEVHDFLAKNENKIISAKKSIIHDSINKFQPNNIFQANKHLANKIEAVKSLFEVEENKYYPIINTTNVIDSHKDVHVNGIWNRSAKDKNRKTYYVFDHKLEALKIIVKAKDVEIKIFKTTFKDLGYDLEGNTEALTFIFDKDKIIHDKASIFLEDEEMQNSIRMRYLDVVLCMNSDKESHKEYKKNYEKYYPIVANKSDIGEEEYFYAVLQAEIVNEGSLVPKGSNQFTPIMYFKEAVKDTSQNKHEPSTDTQNKKVRIFVKF
jgi:hypothetical protein